MISNAGGIALTPAILYHFFRTKVELSFPVLLGKLAVKVLLPVFLGQLLRLSKLKQVCDDNSKIIKRSQEIILLSILWNAFCNAFNQSLGMNFSDGLRLIALLGSLHVVSLASLFSLFKAFRFAPGDVVAGTFVSSQKTLALGLPLVKTIFEGSPNLATYCAPIMVIHPLQLIIGSALIPRLERYTKKKGKDVIK